MSQSLNSLAKDLIKIESEIRSNKKAARYKSLERLDYLCSHRCNELKELLSEKKNNADLTWLSLFEAAHEAIVHHSVLFDNTKNEKEINTLSNKKRDHVNGIIKILDLCDSNSISHALILEKVFHCFGNKTMTKHFGMHYLKILLRNILNSKSDLSDVQNDDWNKMLTVCFPLYECDTIQKSIIWDCIALIIEKGSQFAHLNYDLYKYKTILQNIILNTDGLNLPTQIIKVLYYFCKVVALDFRFAICEFMENILETMIKIYDQNFDTETKEYLFKLLHISLVIHCPDVSSNKSDYAFETDVWNKHLRKMFNMIQIEFNYIRNKITRIQSDVKFSPIFISFGATLCSMIFWNDSVWNITSAAEPKEKRRKKSANKLQGVFDLIECNDNNFGWCWLVILSKLLQKYPSKFETTDYQPLLHILENFPSEIQYSIQIKIYANIIRVMLSKEQHFLNSCKIINGNSCNTIWMNISQMLFRKASANLVDTISYLKCLLVLIEYKKIPSPTFINSIIQTIITNSIKKSNEGIELLITILKNFDIELINNSDEIIINILHWLHFKDSKTNLMQSVNKININTEIIANLTAVCLLSKIDEIEILPISKDNATDDEIYLDNMEKKILFKSLDKLIVVEGVDERIILNNENINLPLQSELKTIINEIYLEKLFLLIGGLSREYDEQTDKEHDYFIYLLSSLELSLHIVNKLVQYDSLDNDKFDKYFLTKRIALKISQIEMFCERIFMESLDIRQANDIFKYIMRIFTINMYHRKLEDMLKSWNCKLLMNWINTYILSKTMYDSENIKIVNLDDFSMEFKLRYNCLLVLSFFCDGPNSVIAFNLINDHHFNFSSNEDIFIIFELIQIIINQKPCENKAIWINCCVKILCKKYHKNHELTERIIDLLPSFIFYVRHYSDLTDDLLNIITSFLIKIKNKRYGPNITEKLIRNVKYIAQAFPEMLQNANFYSIFHYLGNFLKFDNISIQFVTIETLSFIFDRNWLLNIVQIEKYINFKIFLNDLYEKLNIKYLDKAIIDDKDEYSRLLSIHLQTYFTITCKCYMLSKLNWFNFAQFCNNQEFTSEKKIFKLISTICKYLKVQHESLTDNIINYLIAMWLKYKYLMKDFPWYITPSETQSDFFLDNVNSITVSILCYQSDLSSLDDFVTLLQETKTDLLMPILPTSLAYIIPYFSNCIITPISSKPANKIYEILNENIENFNEAISENWINIFENLLNILWDNEKFQYFFDFEIDYIPEENMIDYDSFQKCVEYLQNNLVKYSNIIMNACVTQSIRLLQLLHSLKLKIQTALFVEQKFIYLFHFCVLIDLIGKTLFNDAIIVKDLKNKLDIKKIKDFYLRDIIYFICNELLNKMNMITLKFAICKYFHRFIMIITKSSSCGNLEPFLNVIVSALISLTKYKHQNLTYNALQILELLIIEKMNDLKSAIALLDNFPIDSIFDRLRDVHFTIKYTDKFSLTDEIEYFLKIDKRQIAGLCTLKEHLSSKKSELVKMYKQLQGIYRFSEDYGISNLHRLILSLLTVVRGSDKEKSLEAVKCLGELGPSDLTTSILKPDIQLSTYKFQFQNFMDASTFLYDIITDKLNMFHIHPDARVLAAVSNACDYLLKTQIGQKLKDKYPQLYPYTFTSSKVENASIFIEPNNELHLKIIFEENIYIQHTTWIKKITTELLTLFGDKYLLEIANFQVLFADAILPLLIHMLLTCGELQYVKELEYIVTFFFQQHFELKSGHFDSESIPLFMNKAIIKSMLNIVECIRMYNLKTFRNIPLNFMHIANAAEYCEAYFSSIMYGELWVLNEHITNNISYDILKTNSSLQHIMMEGYKSIGDADAIIPFLNPITSRLDYLKLNNSWNRIYMEFDAIAFVPNQSSANANIYKNILSQSGLYSLANNIKSHDENIIDYNCAWRLGDWKIITNKKSIQSDNIHDNIEKQHYIALKCLENKDEMGIKISIERARDLIITSIKLSSLECTNNIYKSLTMLHMLQQIEDFCDIQFSTSPNIKENVNILNKWKLHDNISCSNFKYREPILAQRVAILKLAGIRAKRNLEKHSKISDILPNTILKLATDCRIEGEINLAIRQLALLNSENLQDDLKAKVLLEDSQLNWLMNDQVLSKKLLYEIIVAKQYQNSLSRVHALRLYGEYLAQSFSENVKLIIERFFNSSLKFLQNISDKRNQLAQHWGQTFLDTFDTFELDNKMRGYEAIAKYADREYIQLANYMKSEVFERKKSNYEKNSTTEKELQGMTDKELAKQKFLMGKQLKIDKQEINNTEKEYSEYLYLALENYIRCSIIKHEFYNLEIFRIISLWFSNSTNTTVFEILKRDLNKISSNKFLSVIPQIAARMCNKNDHFSLLVSEIMEKCAIDHPHHTLYQILALSNAYLDDSQNVNNNKLEPRVIAANQLLNKLKNNEKLSHLLLQMKDMSLALIELANKNVKGTLIPASEPIQKIKNCNLVHCPTLSLPISTTGNYSNIISIVKWDNKFSYVGGVNAPKKLSCQCSNGKVYPQLLKGKDDLRQDAVMQQVFLIINDLLKKHKETAKRKLTIRTYKVVPLSQRSGILEWCSNTMPLGDYLTGSKNKPGAHERYFPTDWKPQKCRDIMKEYKSEPNVNKYNKYKDMCTNLRPVFQHFFFENFLIPGLWYERRLSYINSVSTTSMIGYILGIGDRHVSNILLDNNSAEFIHIDFGIAFDQGKCLPTPETIPFRLTRDIVAAFGVSGVDGIFRTSCEKTMYVLRQNKATIITILEVLLYDPLYAWTLSNKKACDLQSVHSANSENDINDNKNAQAERALLRLEDKLDGKEASGVTTVEAQVELLIQQAISPFNLCRLFEGWQPYL